MPPKGRADKRVVVTPTPPVKKKPRTTPPANMEKMPRLDDKVIRTMPITQKQLVNIKKMYGIK